MRREAPRRVVVASLRTTGARKSENIIACPGSLMFFVSESSLQDVDMEEEEVTPTPAPSKKKFVLLLRLHLLY